MPNLNIKVTADTTQAQANLNAFANQLKNMQGDTNRLASQMGSLSGNVNSFAQALGQTTPRTLELARAYEKLVKDFQNGNINLNQARTAIDSIQKELTELEAASKRGGEGAQSFSLKWTELKSQLDLAVGTFRAVSAAAQEAFDFAKLGAQVNQMGDSFALLIENVGAAPDLFDQLKEAAGGTIPDLTLMSSTAKLLAGTSGDLASAMAEAAPRLLEIARAAVKLDPTLGSVEEVFQSLATGIKRNSPLLIDNANITLKLGTANETLAAQLGKSVEEFTDAERAMAVLNATLEGGDKLIQQVGGTVESETDKFARFEASITNLKNAGASLAADFLSPTVTGLGDVATALADGTGVWDTYWAAVGKFNSDIGSGIVEFAESAATGIETFAGNLLNLDDGLEQTSTMFHNLSDAQLEHAAAFEPVVSGYDALGEGLSNLEDHYANQHLAIEQLVADFEAQAQAEEAARVEMNKWNDAAAMAIERAQNAKPPIDELMAALDQDIESPLTQFISDLNFFIATGAQDFVGAFEAIKGALASGDITPEQALERANELLATLMSAKVTAGEISFNDAAKSLADQLNIPLSEAVTALKEAGTALDTVTGVQRDITITSNAEEIKTQLENIEGPLDMLEGADETLEPLSSGLDDIATAANKAKTAIENLQKAVDSVDTSNAEPYIAESPPPLGEGLDYIANAIPAVVSGINALNYATKSIGKIFNPEGNGEGGGEGGLPGLPGIPDTPKADKFGKGLLNLGELFDDLTKDAEDFTEALFDAAGAFSGLGNAAASMFQDKTIDPLTDAVSGMNDQLADGLKAFEELSGIDLNNVAELKNLLPFLSGDAQAAAQALLDLDEQRTQKAEELAAAEEKILKLKEQQQKIAFLQQQFELIQFLQENGLDPAKILGGLDLGVDADPGALIDAMAAALEQILAQLGGQLGGLGFANGANFVVPPGYPGDSFGPMWASTGEHVSVTRPGEMSGGGMNVNISMSGAIIMSQQEANRMMKNALDQAGAQADMLRRGGR